MAFGNLIGGGRFTPVVIEDLRVAHQGIGNVDEMLNQPWNRDVQKDYS